jgi:hypothetical protein
MPVDARKAALKVTETVNGISSADELKISLYL